MTNRFQQLNILAEGDMVRIVLNGRRLLDIGWKVALELCRAFDIQIRNAEARTLEPTIALEPETRVKFNGIVFGFRQELGRILFIGSGRLLFDANTAPITGGRSIARTIWARLREEAAKAEEYSKAEQVARDAAILHRSGAPFGLTDNPLIQAEALKTAEHDRDLRRFMPNKAKPVILGAPSVILNRNPVDEVLSISKRLAPAELEKLKANLEQKNESV